MSLSTDVVAEFDFRMGMDEMLVTKWIFQLGQQLVFQGLSNLQKMGAAM